MFGLTAKEKAKMKSLIEHNAERSTYHFSAMENLPIKNGIACPNCGNELLDTCPSMTLTSMPPKKNVHCPACDFVGCRVA